MSMSPASLLIKPQARDMTRTTARELAVRLCFALAANADAGPDSFFEEEYFETLASEDARFAAYPDEKQMQYIRALVIGTQERREELDEYIGQYSQGWKTSRISKTAMALLRCALYEILYMPEVPDAAAINEAVELAKDYEEAETVAFINGILGSFMRGRGDDTCEATEPETEEPDALEPETEESEVPDNGAATAE